MTVPGAGSDDGLVPVSVRLGEVVPPEDPEDWTRPMTWVAALGMLAAPLVALAWFVAAPPADASTPEAAAQLLAVTVAVGASVTGATQQGPLRAGTATLGAGLFAALVTIMVGLVMAGERQFGQASPTLAHAFAASAAGLGGVIVAAIVGAVTSRLRSRPIRVLAAALPGSVGALAVLGPLFGR